MAIITPTSQGVHRHHSAPVDISGSTSVEDPKTTAKDYGESRIPLALQAVFIASNRGNDVCTPPPDNSASKVFWLKKRSGQRNNGNATYENKKLTRSNSLFFRFASSLQKTKQDKAKCQPSKGKETDNKGSLNKARAEKELDAQSNHQPASKSSPGTSIKKKPIVHLSPQQYLESLMRSRGYSAYTKRCNSLETAYYNKPTEFQQACYDVCLIRIVKNKDIEAFRDILNCGISPNPCNMYAESVLHTVCRLGEADMLQIMIDAGSDVQVADDYGRTPLHDACWSAKENIFDVIELLLNKAGTEMFFMADCRGYVPLQYVAKDHWADWIQWLESNKELYWPKLTATSPNGMLKQNDKPGPLILSKMPPNSCPAPIPIDPLFPSVAKLVVSGRLTPEEAQIMRYENVIKVEDEDSSSEDDVDASDSCSDETDVLFNEEEMAELLHCVEQRAILRRIHQKE